MKKYLVSVLVLLIGALVLTGCGAGTPASPAAVPTMAATATTASAGAVKAATSETASLPTATSQVVSQPTATRQLTTVPTATVPPAVSPTEESLSLDSRNEALDTLTSYRMRWKAGWSSTEGGKTTTASWDWTEEYVAEGPALHWIWTSIQAEDSSENSMESWQIGDTMYIVTGEKGGESSCISMSSQDQSNKLSKGLFNPSVLGSVKDAKYVGQETVNGIRAKHYTYDEKSLALTGMSKVAGEMWVAVDGGYVVKEMMQWKGGAGLFGAGGSAEGEGQWTWELSDANQPIAIMPPENCGGATAELPILPDAVDKATFGDMLTYASATKLADAVTFYEEEMKAAGWALEGEPMAATGMSTLTFTKDEQTAQVIISEDQGKTTVMISLSK